MHFISKFVGYKPSVGILILRLGVGIVFLVHGIAKLGDIAGTAGFFSSIGIPMATFSAWVVALVETVGGAALILGLGTHIAAALLIIVMLVAIFAAKWSRGFVGGYEFDLVLLTSLLSLVFGGAGKYSLDAKCKCTVCETTQISTKE